MTFSKLSFLILVLGGVLLFPSCDKDDTQAPEIEFISPVVDTEYHNGALTIDIRLTDNEELKSYELTIVSEDGSHELHTQSGDISGKSFSINHDHNFEIPDHSDYILTLTVTDKANNTTTETLQFHMHPTSTGGDTGALMFRLHLKWGDEPFEMFKHYDYPGTTMPFFLTRLSFYLSELKLTNGHGHEHKVLEHDVKYVDLTDDHLEGGNKVTGLHLQGVPVGNYNGLKFNIGLNSGLNGQTPATFPAEHDMSLTGEYWPSWNSYIFAKIEGKADENGDGTFDDPQISLHLGSDEALRSAEFTKDLEFHNGMNTPVDIFIDVQKVFNNGTDIYDIMANPMIHNLDQMPQINELCDNLVGAVEIQ